MSAPSIPNLLSLRGSRGGSSNSRGGRFARRGGGPQAPGAAHDATIQGTDNDAAVSRLSAVELGYLDDPFAQYFVQSAPGPSSRRLPIINRGTYTRTAGLDNLIDRFLAVPAGSAPSTQERQIVSLGAGTDTRGLRLLSRPNAHGITYHEIDFPVTCARKLNIVKAHPAVSRVFASPTVQEDGSWHCETSAAESQCRFYYHGLDLRQLSSSAASPRQDESVESGGNTGSSASTSLLTGLRTDIPTLLISECCLCYLETAEARGVIEWFADRIPSLGILIYEPTRPDDPFGRTMTSNLAARRIRMPTLEAYRLPADQETRLKDAGFDQARQMTVDVMWTRWVSGEEKERVDGLEGLDELEEWNLLAGHYVVAWGWRGSGFSLWEDRP